MFGGDARAEPSSPAVDVETLHAKIGQLALENDFLAGALSKAGPAERQAMIDRDHDLPVLRQAQVLNISRSSVYYRPRPISTGDLALMRWIDALYLEYPFAGARMLPDMLAREGRAVGRLRVSTLMKRMGIQAICRRPNTSKPAPGLLFLSSVFFLEPCAPIID